MGTDVRVVLKTEEAVGSDNLDLDLFNLAARHGGHWTSEGGLFPEKSDGFWEIYFKFRTEEGAKKFVRRCNRRFGGLSASIVTLLEKQTVYNPMSSRDLSDETDLELMRKYILEQGVNPEEYEKGKEWSRLVDFLSEF